MRKLLLIFCLLFCCAFPFHAQREAFRIEGNEMILTLDKRMPRKDMENLLVRFDLKGLPIDSAFNQNSAGKLSSEGWNVRRRNKNKIEIFKSLNFENKIDFIGIPLCIETEKKDAGKQGLANSYSNREFGFNQFKNRSAVEISDSITQFLFFGKESLQNVYLSGSFNNWSRNATPMIWSEGAWRANVKLRPGRHEYKFIADGRWLRDEENKNKIDDNAGGYNSVYFKANYRFKLLQLPDAKKVYLSGSFNDWDPSAIPLVKTGIDWSLDVFLPNGTYYYKFVLDGNWIVDPNNKQIKTDAEGNVNSFLNMGNPVRFFLKGYSKAQNVVLAGSFNGWNETSTVMNKTADGWEFDYVIQEGNYQYKYIVDGNWVTDPNAPTVPSEFYGIFNNYISIDPNFTFTLSGFENAHEVFVTGNFCDWMEPGYQMQLKDGKWNITVHLNPGKILYKFIVDGRWIIDPGNPLWEKNEHDTGNSVMWFGLD